MRIDFSRVRESEGNQDFSLPPLGEYPVVMLVEAYKKDTSGVLMTDPDGRPAPLTTTANDPMWNLELKILPTFKGSDSEGHEIWDSTHAGKRILDNVSFGAKAIKRAAVVLVRAKMMPSEKECEANPKLWATRNRDFQPDELHETFWWVSIHHELAVGKGNVIREGKYPFKARGCVCEACSAAAKKEVENAEHADHANDKHCMVNAKPDYDGYRLMVKEEIKKHRPMWEAMQKAAADKASGAPAGEDGGPAGVGDDDVPF